MCINTYTYTQREREMSVCGNGVKNGCIIVVGDWLVVVDERESGEVVKMVIGGL